MDRVSVGGDEEVLEVGGGGGCPTMSVSLTSHLMHT